MRATRPRGISAVLAAIAAAAAVILVVQVVRNLTGAASRATDCVSAVQAADAAMQGGSATAEAIFAGQDPASNDAIRDVFAVCPSASAFLDAAASFLRARGESVDRDQMATGIPVLCGIVDPARSELPVCRSLGSSANGGAGDGGVVNAVKAYLSSDLADAQISRCWDGGRQYQGYPLYGCDYFSPDVHSDMGQRASGCYEYDAVNMRIVDQMVGSC